VNNYLQRAKDAIAEVTRGMSAEQLTKHPEGKWCAAEILEHLDRVYSTCIPHLQKCLDRGSPTATRPTVWQRLATGLVVDFGYLPSGRKAPEFAVPKGAAADQLLRDIPVHLAAMDRVLEECARRFGARRKLANHVILGPLSVEQWRKFHWVHTRHHVKQIARLRQNPLTTERAEVHRGKNK
jgi:Protein of unknown function (DUF1569)